MEDFDLILAINSEQIPVKVHPHIEEDKTHYDVLFTNYTLTIYKETMYTWTSDDPQGLSQADIQTIGEQIDTRE